MSSGLRGKKLGRGLEVQYERKSRVVLTSNTTAEFPELPYVGNRFDKLMNDFMDITERGSLG